MDEIEVIYRNLRRELLKYKVRFNMTDASIVEYDDEQLRTILTLFKDKLESRGITTNLNNIVEYHAKKYLQSKIDEYYEINMPREPRTEDNNAKAINNIIMSVDELEDQYFTAGDITGNDNIEDYFDIEPPKNNTKLYLIIAFVASLFIISVIIIVEESNKHDKFSVYNKY